MKKISIIKIMIVSLMLILFRSVSYCEGTIRMQVVYGGALWDNITVSESYAECQNLNSSTSTLGTTGLRAHLTTDADWSIMAIFSVSQYGGATSNTPAQTTGNKSGIYNIEGDKWIQTTGILESASSTGSNWSGLFDGDNVKPYVRKWSTDREATNFVGFIDTFRWYSARGSWSIHTGNPLSIRVGLFGVAIADYGSVKGTGGQADAQVTFRPVIWN